MRISSDQHIFSMSSRNKPVLKVASGTQVVFETLDCFSNAIQSSSDLISEIDFDRINPATGPLYIEGAEKGDTLKVTIDNIKINEQGATVQMSGLGVLGEDVKEDQTEIAYVKDNYVDFLGHSVPLRKMIGVIGVAEGEEGVNTGTPGLHGGNMDATSIQEGAHLYFPVKVQGALLAMGDLHAAMGDGEIGGAGIEVSGEVTVTVEVLKETDIPSLTVETQDKWITIAPGKTMEEAARDALSRMEALVLARTSLTPNEAKMLLSIGADVRVCQLVNPAITMRVELLKSILEQ